MTKAAAMTTRRTKKTIYQVRFYQTAPTRPEDDGTLHSSHLTWEDASAESQKLFSTKKIKSWVTEEN